MKCLFGFFDFPWFRLYRGTELLAIGKKLTRRNRLCGLWIIAGKNDCLSAGMAIMTGGENVLDWLPRLITTFCCGVRVWQFRQIARARTGGAIPGIYSSLNPACTAVIHNHSDIGRKWNGEVVHFSVTPFWRVS